MKLLTSKEVAAMLQLNFRTIERLAARGGIPAKKIGKVWRFDAETIKLWVQAAP